jgi:hypothetical protein
LAPIGLRAHRTLGVIATVGMAGGPNQPTTTENVTHTQIAERLGIDRWGVQREIDALIGVGLLRVESRRSGNRYTILFDDVSSQETAPAAAAGAVSRDDIVSSQETTSAASRVVSGDDALTEAGSERGELASLATRARTYDPGDFETFWKAYPHQVAKPVAESAYRRAIVSGASPADILAGLQLYIAAIISTDRSWCNPATFLRHER